MIKVGVIGMGMMGQTHLDIYGNREDVVVAALADQDEDRLHGKTKAQGNIKGQAQGGVDLAEAKRYTSAEELIADPEVDLVDICLPTPLHRSIGEKALDAGKHVMIEKPLARTAEDAFALAERAKSAKGLTMPGMCMRFWPGWTWLKEAIDDQRFGKLLSAHFRRLTSHPGGPFYSDGKACGGAALDLHVHDADTIQWCLGMPDAVNAQGHTGPSGNVDYIATQYHYNGGPTVSAEGGWTMADGFGFEMQYTANFERGTARFDINADAWLKTIEPGGEWQSVSIADGMGYEHEIAYLLDCIAKSTAPSVVTLADAAESVRLVEAEVQSVQSSQPVKL